MRAVISVRALAIVAPSRNRATPRSVKRKDALARVDWAAIHTSVRGNGNANVAGMTPITCVGTPFNRIDWPTMPGSSPYRRAHRPCESTAVGAAPVSPSCSANHRPSAGCTRSTFASDGVA